MTCGYYQIEIKVRERLQLPVGSLGECIFPPGLYIYTGSGGRALRARVARHFYHRSKSKHWHIDYLLEEADPVGAHLYYPPEVEVLRKAALTEGEAVECFLNGLVADREDAHVQVPGFGSSDCRCSSHLIRFASPPPDLFPLLCDQEMEGRAAFEDGGG